MGDRAHLGRQGDMRGLESGVKPFRGNYVDQMSAKTRLKFPPRIFSTAALL